MQQQFVETIKISNGKAANLPYHQARMERTIRHFFPQLALMPRLQDLITPKDSMSLFKARVVYGTHGVELVEYAPYSMRQISTLKIVHDDTISYSYKYTDRSVLNALTAQKADCDEIIIVKNNLITDTSFTNLALFDDPQTSPTSRHSTRPTLGQWPHQGGRHHRGRPNEGEKNQTVQCND